MVFQGEVVDVEGGGQEDGHHVAHSHAQQHCVGGGPHLGSGEDDDDDGVEDAGDTHQGWHDETVYWLN